MNLPRILLLTLALAHAASAVAADAVRVGSLEGNSMVFTGPRPSTLIDWSRPAGASGDVNTASVAWTAATSPCDSIFYVRFYVIPSNALQTTMIAERGPFRAVDGINTVSLNPPVPVTPETYIGIRRAEGADTCGMPYGTFTRDAARALIITDADFKNGSLTGLTPLTDFRLQAQASSGPSVRVSTLPVVGAAPGAFGSFFRTALTLSNPSPVEIRGSLRLRVAGRAGSDSDPTLDYVIPANGTLNYADVLTAMGQSGLGSLDVLTTASPTPIATARVFNDAGAAGTNGLSEEAVPAAPNYLSLATVFIPTDAANFRLNVGIRTFTAGDLRVAIYDAQGRMRSLVTKSYPADYFEQVPASTFVNESELPPGGKIVVSAFQKSFIVYGAATDNRTNDPSMRIGND